MTILINILLSVLFVFSHPFLSISSVFFVDKYYIVFVISFSISSLNIRSWLLTSKKDSFESFFNICDVSDVVRDHPFSTYAKFSVKLTFFTPETNTFVYVSRGKNVSFSENFAYLLNGWTLITLINGLSIILSVSGVFLIVTGKVVSLLILRFALVLVYWLSFYAALAFLACLCVIPLNYYTTIATFID